MCQRPCEPLMHPGTPSTYMAPCSGAAGGTGLCLGALLGALAPALVLEHHWHHQPHGLWPCNSPSPTDPGPVALLAPQLPALGLPGLQVALLGGTLAMGVPRGRPGQGALAGQDAQVLSL